MKGSESYRPLVGTNLRESNPERKVLGFVITNEESRREIPKSFSIQSICCWCIS